MYYIFTLQVQNSSLSNQHDTQPPGDTTNMTHNHQDARLTGHKTNRAQNH